MKYKKLIIFGSLFLIVILWLISWYYVDDKFSDLQDRGTFGDKFGFINSLFSGLALTGIIISIYFQQYELKLQRKELADTRNEFKDQNFQTTFFNLLKTQRNLADEINCDIWNIRNYEKENVENVSGRKFFTQSKIELIRIINILRSKKHIKYRPWSEQEDEYYPNSAEDAEDLTRHQRISFTLYYYEIDEDIFNGDKKNNENGIAELAYAIFFNKFNYVIGHYFRHFYHILKFLENFENEILNDEEMSEKEKSDKKVEILNFSNFIQAQMSTPEMFLLYYNCYAFPKLKKLVIK